jgi:hypothetical protein
MIFSLLSLLFFGAIYFVPAALAGGRRHHNAGAIFLLNLVAGWTFVGWIAALVWSATVVRRTPTVARRTPEEVQESRACWRKAFLAFGVIFGLWIVACFACAGIISIQSNLQDRIKAKGTALTATAPKPSSTAILEVGKTDGYGSTFYRTK